MRVTLKTKSLSFDNSSSLHPSFLCWSSQRQAAGIALRYTFHANFAGTTYKNGSKTVVVSDFTSTDVVVDVFPGVDWMIS